MESKVTYYGTLNEATILNPTTRGPWYKVKVYRNNKMVELEIEVSKQEPNETRENIIPITSELGVLNRPTWYGTTC